MELPIDEFSRLKDVGVYFRDVRGAEYLLIQGVIFTLAMEVSDNGKGQISEAEAAFRIDNPDGIADSSYPQ